MRVPTLVLGLVLPMSSAAAQLNAMHQGPATAHVAIARSKSLAFPTAIHSRASIGTIGSGSDTMPGVSLGAPAFVMFSPVNGTLRRIAVAYAVRLRLETPRRGELGSDSSAMWHIQMAKPDALADLRRQYESILTTSAMH